MRGIDTHSTNCSNMLVEPGTGQQRLASGLGEQLFCPGDVTP